MLRGISILPIIIISNDSKRRLCMANKIVCFTDIKGSTTLAQTIGHEAYRPLLESYLHIGKTLIENNKGKYYKNAGDAHLCSFVEVDDALRFASSILQFYKNKPCFNTVIEVRVAIFQGEAFTVELGSKELVDDIFGSAVNQAARVEGETQSQHVLVNADFYNSAQIVFGKDKAAEFFKLDKDIELRGVTGKQKLFHFDWMQYATGFSSLSRDVYNCIEKAGVVPTNINIDYLCSSGTVIWPVVPREVVTAIHRGQLEIIRLLSYLGWKILFIAADCGGNSSDIDTTSFIAKIRKHAEKRGLVNIEFKRLSEYFDVAYDKHGKVLDKFKQVTSFLSLQDMLNINHKYYAEDVKDDIRKDSSLKFIRPILTCAVVMHLIKDEFAQESKSIVIAGDDEELQWRHLLERSEGKLGAIYNPLLKTPDKHTARQSKNWPHWISKAELIKESSSGSNAALWAFQLFAQLPSFPATTVCIDEKELTADIWTNEATIPAEVNFPKVVDHIWPILDPA